MLSTAMMATCHCLTPLLSRSQLCQSYEMQTSLLFLCDCLFITIFRVYLLQLLNYGKVGRVASEEVVLQLVNKTCMMHAVIAMGFKRAL